MTGLGSGDDGVVAEFGYGVGIEAQYALQHRVGMLPQQRRRLVVLDRCLREPDRVGDARDLARDGMFEFELQAAMPYLRVGEHLLNVIDRTAGNTAVRSTDRASPRWFSTA